MALYVNESSSAVYVGGKLVPAGQSRDVPAPVAFPNTPASEAEPPSEDPDGGVGHQGLPGELAPGGDGQTADGLPDPITAGKRQGP